MKKEINVFIPSYYLPNPNVSRNPGKIHTIRNGFDEVIASYNDETEIFSEVITAAKGCPLPMGLPSVTISGIILCS